MKKIRFVVLALMMLGAVACKKDNEPTEGPLIVRDKNQAANCYVIRPKDRLQFVAVEGNTDTKIKDVSRAVVIWETNNTTARVSSGEIIKKISYSDGNVLLTAGKEGNALVAVKNADGEILWSWHIWVTRFSLDDKVLSLRSGSSSYMLMDRNLGALTADVKDPLSNGLMYQFNRKDPFPGLAKFNEGETSPQEKCQMGIRGTIEYDLDENWPTRAAEMVQIDDWLTAHPNTYIAMKGLSAYLSLRWSETVKSNSDPCPYGYRIAPRQFWEPVLDLTGEFYENYVDIGENNINYPNFKLPYCGYRSNTTDYAFSYQGAETPGNYSMYMFADTKYNSYVFKVYWGEPRKAGSSEFFKGTNVYERAGAVRCIKM